MLGDQLYTLRINYGGSFGGEGGRYIRGKVHTVKDVDPDLMSYFEIIDLVKEMGYPATTVVWFIMPAEVELKMLDSDIVVMEMFRLYASACVHEIDLFLDVDTVEIDPEITEADNEDNSERDEFESETDPDYDASTDSESEDGLSDFEFFAEGDTLSDSCDPIGDHDAETNISHPVSYDEVEKAFVTGEKYIQSDPEILTEPSDSDCENTGLKFPEFDEGSEMKNPELAVGLVFANSSIFRKALRRFSIVRGFELKFEKNERKRVTASCKNKCGWRIHASLQEWCKPEWCK